MLLIACGIAVQHQGSQSASAALTAGLWDHLHTPEEHGLRRCGGTLSACGWAFGSCIRFFSQKVHASLRHLAVLCWIHWDTYAATLIAFNVS